MNKNILKFVSLLCLLVLIFLIPYFTTDFLDPRQKKENEANYQKLLKEEARKKAEQKIYLLGKFDPAERENFVLIPPEYTLEPNKMYHLRKETLTAFLKMQDAANKDKINLKIASATRNFDQQKELWNKKWTEETIIDGKDLSKSIPDGQERFRKILKYNAVPGTSRHHWGTDIDINDANPEYFDKEKGKEIYEWLIKNAYQFGFCQTYNLKGSIRPTGYNEEKWHWSYLPLSRTFMQEYKNLIRDKDIKEFLGDEYASSLNLINDYVLRINPECI